MLNYLLPPNLMSKGIKTITNEFAWKYEDIIKVINFLKKEDYIILGGDVLNGKLEYTYDNWFYEPNNTESNREQSEKSIIKSKQYIDWYHDKFGDEFYYIIVVSGTN